VFQPDNFGESVVLEGVFVIPAIQVKNLVNKDSLSKDQFIDLERLIIYQHANPMCVFTIFRKRDFDDDLANLVHDLIFDWTLEEHRGDGVFAEDNVVA
jgi:hypothetical protein